MAHLQTGAPVMVHTHPGTKRGLEVAATAARARRRARPGPQLAHSGDSTDVDHLSELAEAGFLLGMDRFGLETTLARQRTGSRPWPSCPLAGSPSG